MLPILSQKMVFEALLHQKEAVLTYRYLSSDFQHLRELELWGGSFYSDGLFELLQNVGTQVSKNKLSFAHA